MGSACCDSNSLETCGCDAQRNLAMPPEHGIPAGEACISIPVVNPEVEECLPLPIPAICEESTKTSPAESEGPELPSLQELRRQAGRGGDCGAGQKAAIWLPSAIPRCTQMPRMPRGDSMADIEEGTLPSQANSAGTPHVAVVRKLIKWRLEARAPRPIRSAGGVLQLFVPPRLKAMASSAARDISVAARVHTGATVAVVIPRGVPLPTEAELAKRSLRHPANVRGWATLTDGSALGLMQVMFEQNVEPVRRYRRPSYGTMLPEGDLGWANHGQAKALYRAQIEIVKLLGSRVPVDKQAELRRAPRTDCHEVLSSALPGARMWPLHDPLVSRVFLLNISRERFRSFRSCIRLDRGLRFLDFTRLHYGEEVAFLFAWHSHYIYSLAAFVALTVPLIVARTVQGKGHIDHSMLPHSLISLLFGVALTEFWRPRAKRLVYRWHVHGDCTSRWHRLVLDLLESHAAKTTQHDQSTSDDERRMSEGNLEVASPLAAEDAAEGSSAAESSSLGDETSDEIPDEFEAGPPILQISNGAPVDSSTSEEADVSMTPEQMESRTPRPFQTRALTQLEAAAVDACIDTFGMRVSRPSMWRSLRCGNCWQDVKRLLKASLFFPVLLFEWLAILVFFSMIVWFEIWVIFDWGGCREYNMQFEGEDWECVSADMLRGFWGGVMGALPSIAEGALFELLLLISKVTAHGLISLFEFRTREQHDFAVVTIIFALEVVGKVGFILVLGLGFVPAWSSHHWSYCRRNWDYFIFGEWSLGCLKGQIPFEVRLKLFESVMKGPMWVSGLVGIMVKVLLPYIIGQWRRCVMGPTTYEDGCRRCRCRRFRLIRWILAPLDLILRVSMLILQVDCGAVGGLRLICRWPASLAKTQPPEKLATKDLGSEGRLGGFGSTGVGVSAACEAEVAQVRAAARRAKLSAVLLEGERKEHEPFDEYIELLLHFLWTSCFAIVWPLGCAFSIMNQLLELRFDCIKLLAVRRRRFPSTRHMSVAWVPRFAQIICHIGIVVNVALLMMPYRQLLIWSPGSCASTKDGRAAFLTHCANWQIASAFMGTWACFLVILLIAQRVFRRIAKHMTPSSRVSRPSPPLPRTPSPRSPTRKLNSLEFRSRRKSSSRSRRQRSASPSTRPPDVNSTFSVDSLDSLGMRAEAQNKH